MGQNLEIMIYRFLLTSIIAAMILVSCGSNEEANKDVADGAKSEASANKLGLIDTDVASDAGNALSQMPQYSTAAAGTAEKIDRAFENAPPMIPHMTEGFFPITRANNICLTCHMPDKSEAVGSVAIPVSHFTDYRPALIRVGGKYKVDADEGEVVAKKLNKLSPTRFNCSQCHVPQANVTIDIKNTFNAVFRNKDSKSSSNLNENIGEGVK